MDLFPYLHTARLRSFFFLFFLLSQPVRALDFCDVAEFQDDYGRLTAHNRRVGPADLFEARVCTAWQSWKVNGGEIEKELPEAEFLTMVFEGTRQFKDRVTHRMKQLCLDTGLKESDIINISDAVPAGKQTDQTLHQATVEAMKAGKSLIVRPFLMTDARFAHPDFLIKVRARAPPEGTVLPTFSSGLSFLGDVYGQPAKLGDESRDYFYLPVIIKGGSPWVKNYNFDPDALGAPTELRAQVKSDYSVLMLHTLAVLQEVQYGVQISADKRIFQPQGIFILKDRQIHDPRSDESVSFSFFSRDNSGPHEKRLDRAFDPGHRAHIASFQTAFDAKNAAEPVRPHYSSACKTCPLHDQHVPEMERAKDVSLIYMVGRDTAAHFRQTRASHGDLADFDQIAKLSPEEAIRLFPKLDGVGAGNTVPELYRIIRQARALRDKVAIDNSPPPEVNIPRSLVVALSSIGIYSFKQLLDLEQRGVLDPLGEMLANVWIKNPEEYEAAKKLVTQKKTALSKALKADGGGAFGAVWEFDHLLRDMQAKPDAAEGLLGILVAISKYESGYHAAPEEVSARMGDLMQWTRDLQDYRYFDVLTITHTDRQRFDSRYAIYFDIEGDPELRADDAPWMKTEYAWGLRVVDQKNGKVVHEEVLVLRDFNLDGMHKVWEQFLKLIRKYEEARIYYFSDYESEVIGRFLKTFESGNPKKKKIFSQKGLAYFSEQAGYDAFVREYGSELADPHEFDSQRAVVEFILRERPAIPDDPSLAAAATRAEFDQLRVYVDLSSQIRGRMVDLRREINDVYTLPVYSYDLKTIAKAYGFKWRDAKSNALQSIVWFRQYIELKDTDPGKADAFLQKIIVYNVDDVRATELLHLFVKVRLGFQYIPHMTNHRKNTAKTSYLQDQLGKAAKALNKKLSS